jgi:hypothetical protein
LKLLLVVIIVRTVTYPTYYTHGMLARLLSRKLRKTSKLMLVSSAPHDWLLDPLENKVTGGTTKHQM